MKTKRNMRKRYRKPVLYRQPVLRNNLVSATRMQTIGTVLTLSASAGWTTYPFTFQLANLPAYTEFSNLFDQYRVNAVKLTFLPSVDGNDAGNVLNMTNWCYQPRIYTLIDRNGINSGAINTEALLQENTKARLIRNPLKPFSIYIKSPGVELGVGAVAGTSNLNAATAYNRWIDTSANTVSHYGAAVGGIVPNGTTNASILYTCVAKYYLQFKNIST